MVVRPTRVLHSLRSQNVVFEKRIADRERTRAETGTKGGEIGAACDRLEKRIWCALRIAEVPHRCPTCGGGGYRLEHFETAFKTLEEAMPHVEKLNGGKRPED